MKSSGRNEGVGERSREWKRDKMGKDRERGREIKWEKIEGVEEK
jgi:hypothetical protein